MRRVIRGFTLIELVVVVAIIAFLAAVVIPIAISRVRHRPSVRSLEAPIEQRPLSVQTESGPPPQIVRSDVYVRLGTRPILDGVDVASEYVATFTGTFDVMSTGGVAELVFSLPPGVEEARNVSLAVGDSDGDFAEPAGVRYGTDGIRWTTTIAPAQILRVRVRYEAIGRDAFVYDIAGAGRTESVRFVLDVDESAGATIPSNALAPSSRDGRRITWSFDRLIATRPIRVDLAPTNTPLGRLVLLCRLAAIGVLLFGAGFWYLSEQRRPGALDRFRFAHFLLLALDYSIFFVLLAVLGFELGALPAIAGAAVVGLPLLGVHVAKVTDTRFAITGALPVAVATWAAVALSVWSPSWQPMVWTATAVAALAYVTVTYRSWQARRDLSQEERATRRAFTEAVRGYERSRNNVEQARREAEAAVGIARAAIAEAHAGFELEAASLTRAADILASTIGTPPPDGAADERTAKKSTLALDALQERIMAERAILTREHEALESAQRAVDERMWRVLRDLATSGRDAAAAIGEVELVLGRGLAPDTAAANAIVEIEALRGAIAEADGLARDAAKTDTTGPRERIAAATHVLARIGTHRKRLDAAAVHLAPRSDDAADRHCAACGGAMLEDAKYCPTCGVAAPEVFDCARCGDDLRVPVHLARRRWTEAALHCEGCGDALR